MDDPGLAAGAKVLDDLGESAQADARRDSAAPLREQGPHLADGAGDGGAVHAEPAASTSCVVPWRRLTSVASSRSTKTNLCFAPAPTARRRDRAVSRA
ncbi:hypothetical protein [Streptomyces sp. NBC_01092]|uniref:hypothetical protein n=1 Tax=Streptomyces sp. NBC_01092 TaxID=2903748 RepID=UPI00386F07C3|nr:hypothetical protein OG254_00415 [Streptomyces sp. NBC_01092]